MESGNIANKRKGGRPRRSLNDQARSVQSSSVTAFCLHLDPSQQFVSRLLSGMMLELEVDLLAVAFLTSVNAASSFLVSPSAGAGAAGFEPSAAGAASAFAGAGAVAGAGAAGVVSVGFASAGLEASAVVVGLASSFLAFFLNRPLKAFFTWAIASGAVMKEYVRYMC